MTWKFMNKCKDKSSVDLPAIYNWLSVEIKREEKGRRIKIGDETKIKKTNVVKEQYKRRQRTME